MKTFVRHLIAFALAVTPTTAFAQQFAVDSFRFSSGGGTSTGSIFAVSGAFKPVGLELMSGGNISVSGEFVNLVPASSSPLDAPRSIFDNSAGSENGGFGITETTWLASKFCLGSRAYKLTSVGVLLNSQDFSGAAGPPSTVHLQIYSNDPTSGKPSADLGVNMTLSGFTNPVTLLGGMQIVTWTPATPFTLAPNTCYWAVLRRESGGAIGQIASFTMPTGDAASFGQTRSLNAGATWGTPDNFSNFKMVIQGVRQSEWRITAVETLGNDLKLSFTALAGQNYAIQTRADVSSGTWVTLPGTTHAATDGTVQVILTNATAAPQRFYRIQALPASDAD